MSQVSEQYDVAIIGGGPGGSTTSVFLKMHCPEMRVLVLERERFPRDHVGESLLPMACAVLNEMGCWDKIEQAGFPVKVGATYRWGATPELWNFDFLVGCEYEDAPRPARYGGQRSLTAFQVDRSIYDKILLDHAAGLGVEVREDTKVVEVLAHDGRVNGLKLNDGSTVTARHYVDASGHSGILRNSLKINVSEPSALRNVALWDYWQNAEWAVNIGVSGTRIQVLSVGWGWIWFIPLSPTRTSVGLVLPADYYKKSGKRPQELYREALDSEKNVKKLLTGASCENNFATTKDWSFVSDQIAGENWLLVGEAAGFADPILSAGVSITHVGAKEAAFTILELDRGELPAHWLKQSYERRSMRRVAHHIRFADYWYSANTQASDLIGFSREIAKDAGLELDAKNAWQWLGTGGFIDDESDISAFISFTFASVKGIVNAFSNEKLDWEIAKNNIFKADLEGAEEVTLPFYASGRVRQLKGWRRNGKTLPCNWLYGYLLDLVKNCPRIDQIMWQLDNRWCKQPGRNPYELFLAAAQGLEAMISDGWVRAERDPSLPLLDPKSLHCIDELPKNTDNKYREAVGD